MARKTCSAIEGHRKMWGNWLARGVDRRAIEAHLLERRPFIDMLSRALCRLRGRGPIRTLEIGCGTGIDSALLALQKGVEATVSDIVPEALEIARQGAATLGTTVQSVVADGERLPFDDGRFDLVFHHGLIEHFECPGKIARETVRVLRPGGLAVIAAPQRFSGFTLFKRWKMRRGTWAHGWEREFAVAELLRCFNPDDVELELATGYDLFAGSVVRAIILRLLGKGTGGRRAARVFYAPFSILESLLPDRLRARLLKNLVIVLRRRESGVTGKRRNPHT